MNAVQKTTVDWLTFRAQVEPVEVLEATRPMFGTLGPDLRLKSCGRGRYGFQQAAQIVVEDMPVARLDFGGASQRGWVRTEIPGKGCEWVQDWSGVQVLEDAIKAQPRRLDLALTTWHGEMSHEQVLAAHAAGRFTTGGRPPELRQITSSDPTAGRTCYVGTREKSAKFMRTYEKGWQMIGATGVRELGWDLSQASIDGCPAGDIYRVELELKAVDCRPLEWDQIERRDQYFAGAYPFCADILPGIEPDVLMRRKERAPQTDLAAMLAHCRTQYGNALFTALTAYHGDMGAVWEKIIGREHCQRLLEAGVLLVDHE